MPRIFIVTLMAQMHIEYFKEDIVVEVADSHPESEA
jgi:hypothetical protein